ncbi:MBL fold metallo-hydrolase [Desulfovermiculus halophilus]|uniref:MBL fold metallo-hydrolase n=1 Tax=Desulfovermiculus halophilus TaxID=339722 RepID=UPI0004878596|nr:MBL fold metallo-hydrolase [Desulfovermiculus halophilus]
MFLTKVRSEGLAHLSYIVGDKGQAAVIDPRRDCQEYIEIAYAQGTAITHIFETHKHEDFISGAQELSRRTGATIHHGANLDFGFGSPVHEDDEFFVGNLLLRVLETPGHTDESISLVLTDTTTGSNPVAVFTGDALFVGDVGRTDFYPGQEEAKADLLYASLTEKILPLGDHVIVYPGHGAGSVCGSGMAEREFSTLGLERLNNPMLQLSRSDFVKRKSLENHVKPPYFSVMEEYNARGNAPRLDECALPTPMAVDDFAQAKQDGMQVVDLRMPEAIAGALIPSSLAIPLSMIPAYAGFFLKPSQKIGLIVDSYEQVKTAMRHFQRIGLDHVIGFIEEGLHAWEASGRCFERIPTVHVRDVVRRIQNEDKVTILDIRKENEFQAGHLRGSMHVFLGHLEERLEEIPKDRPVITFCGSGRRAIVAASVLKKHGFEEVENCLGSMQACAANGCPVVSYS